MALRSSDNDEAMLGSVAPAEEPSAFTFDATSGGEITLPSGRILSDSTYLQQGDDLVLIGTDGTTFTVRDYFLLDTPPDLVAVDGGRMTPALVDSFTPPEAAGQYAQAGQLAQAATPIGQVQDQTGQAFAVRADGSRVALQAGDPVFQGDVIETGDGGAVSLLFVDETTFALGDSARLALDEMVYNPTTQEGQSSFSILKGVFVFVSGQIAHTDNTKMTVTTPVATIGIRGTRVAGDVRPAGEESKFTVIDGEIAIITQGGTVLMGDPNATTRVTSFQAPPSEPFVLSQEEVVSNYGSTGGVSGGLGSPGDISPEAGGGGIVEGDVVSVTNGPLSRTGEASGEEDNEEEPDFGRERAVQASEEDPDEDNDDEEEEEEVAVVEEEEEDDEDGLLEEEGEGDGEEILTTFDASGSPDPQTFVGSDSSEQILGGQAGDDLSGVGGADVIFGNEGNDNIDGGEGNDVLIGGDGNDSVFGGAGDDILIAASGQGDDIYNGGDGADLAVFSSAIESISVDLLQGSASGVDIDNDILIDIENVIGGAGDDNITGDGADNSLFGGGGNDTLVGGDGNDTVSGGDGDDKIIASNDFADDFYDGGAGTDTADYSLVSSGVVIDLAAGFASYNPGELGVITDTVINFENAAGGASGDTITGTSGNNIFFGSTGDDTYNGGAGFDQLTYDIAGLFIDFSLTEIDGPRKGTVSGAGFTDTFVDVDDVRVTAGIVNVLGSVRTEFFGGSIGNDTIDGAGGNDFLDGNAGDDIVRGGLGDDLIVFDAADSDSDGGGGTDTLHVETSGNVIDFAAGALASFEIVDLDPASTFEGAVPEALGNNTIIIDADDIIGNTENDTLSIIGDATNTIESVTPWGNPVDQVVIDGITFDQFTFNGATLQVDVRIGFGPNTPTFTGLINNSWSNDNNWSTGSQPADGDTAQIDSDANYNVEGDPTILASLSGEASLDISDGRLLVSGGTDDFNGNVFMDGSSGFGGAGNDGDLVTLDGNFETNGSDIDLVGNDGITVNGNISLGGTVNLATDLTANSTVIFQDQFVADNSGGSINNNGTASATGAAVTVNTLFSNAGGLVITRSDFTTDGFENLSGGSVVIEVGSRNSSLASTGGLTNNGDITLDSSLNEEGESAAITVSGDVFRNEADGTINLINATSDVIDAQLLNLGAINVSGFGDTRFIGTSFAHNGGNIAMAAGSEIRIVGGTFDLNGGDITASGAAAVSMEGGTLDLSLDFTAASDLTFSFDGTATVIGNGIFTNLGTFDVNTNLDLSTTLDNTDGVLDIVGGSTLTVNSGGALVLGNDGVVTGGGEIRFESGASFDVAANESFDLSSATAEIELNAGANIGGAGTFTNTGLADVVDVDITVDVDTLVNQSGGTLLLANNTVTIDTANFSNDLGGTLEIDSTAGETAVSFGSGWTNNGVISLIVGDIPLVNVAIEFGANTLTNSTSGVIEASGLSGGGNHVIRGNVQNDGQVIVTNGNLAHADGIFTNSGTVDVGDGNFLTTVSSLINDVSGVINLNTSGVMQVLAPTVTNDGVLDMGTGALNISNNGVFLQNSNLTIGNGAVANVSFDNVGGTLGGTGTVTVDAGGAINLGTGGVLGVDTVNGGLISSNNNIFTVNGTLTNQGVGSVDFADSSSLSGTGAFVNTGLLDIADINITVDIDNFVNQSGSTLRLTENTTAINSANFSNDLGATLELDSTNGQTVANFGSDWTNNGVINLTSDADLQTSVIGLGANTLTNSTSGVIEVGGESDLTTHQVTGNFQNDGQVNILNGGALFGVGISTNSGTIDVGNNQLLKAGAINTDSFVNDASGTISLNSGGRMQTDFGTVTNEGVLDMGTGALNIASNSVFLQNSNLTIGNGAVANVSFGDSGGTLGGTGAITVDAGGAINLGAGGVLDVDGALTIQAAGIVDFGDSGTLTGTGAFVNDSDVTMTTAGNISIANFTNTGDFTFDAGNFALATGVNFSNAAGGTLQLDGTTATTRLFFESDWTNDGVINLTSDTASQQAELRSTNGSTLTNSATGEILIDGTTTGTQVFSANFQNDGVVNFADAVASFSGANTYVNNNIFNIETGASLFLSTTGGAFSNSNTGAINLNGGILQLDSETATNDGALNANSGALNILGDGNFVQNTDVTFTSGSVARLGLAGTGGTLSGTGTVTIDAGAFLEFNAGGVLDSDTVNNGTVSTSDGLYTVNGTLTLEAAGEIDIADNTFGGTGVYLSNESTNFGLGTIADGATYIQNAGALSTGASGMVNNGLIEIGAGGTTSGISTISGTGTIDNLGTMSIGDTTIQQTKLVNQDELIASASNTMSVATITNSAGAGISVNGVGADFAISMGGSGTLNNLGFIDIGATANFSVQDGIAVVAAGSGEINIADNGSLEVDIGGTLSNFGNIDLGVGPGSATIRTLNGGVFRNEVSGTVTGAVDTSVRFEIDAADADSRNLGTMVFNENVTFAFEGANSVFTNEGTIDISNPGGAGLTLEGPGGNGGTFVNASGATITVDDEANSIVNSDGVNVIIVDLGSIDFGASPGSLTITGDYSRGDTAFMEFELGGLAAGVHDGFDQLTVGGTLAAGGTLNVVEFGDFDVNVDDSFTIVQAGTISGEFADIAGLDVGGGVVLDATQSASAVTLTGKAVTHQGDGSDNILTGSAGDDVFSAGAGNDTVVGNGGADLVHTGDGDDVFVAPDTSFGRFDGGSGTDLVTFDGAGQNFDLTSLRGDQLSGIERIDFGGFGDNILTLDTDMAFAATGNENALTGEAHSLVIDGDAGDTVNAIGDWTNTGTVTIEGTGYSVFQNSANDAQIFVDDDVAVSGVA